MPSFSLNGPGLWYLTRATGVITLILLTFSVFLGVVTVSRYSTRRTPRFVVVGLHRNVSLLVLVFLTLHVTTTVVDTYTSIGLVDAVVPFQNPYRTVWLGLGAVASDLLIAVTVTSLLRQRLGHRLWRLIHWLSYACWPVALLHAWRWALIPPPPGAGSSATSASAPWPTRCCGGSSSLRGATPQTRWCPDVSEIALRFAPPTAGLPRLLAGAWAEGSASLDLHLANHGPHPVPSRPRPVSGDLHR